MPDRLADTTAASAGASLVGVDTGGTFSDVVGADGAVVKVLSTPAAPDEAIAEGLAALPGGGGAPTRLHHGTTVATNALLEGRLAEVALYTDDGFADVIEIGRQDRPSLYDQFADRPPALVPRDRRVEVAGRVAADGSVLEPVGDVPDPPVGTETVAVCLLHADLHPAHEQAVAGSLRARGWDVSASHEVSPQFREFERTVTTVVNAGLRPRCRSYLERVDALAGDVWVMTSGAGLLPAGVAAELPAALLLSGPAGGVRAAGAYAVACGYPDAVSFDMGGTSTDVCLITGGAAERAGGRVIAGHPVRFPAVDIHTIGAGGGSIARIDAGGALVVGPESAGADPGPACYGRGGTRPTVTDADVVAGHIPTGARFGPLELDVVAARRALDAAALDAEGVIRVVEANMERALRTVTVERGVDPRRLALVAFGGAGPLHACGLADAMGFAAVVVPPRAGVLSAVGLLAAPPSRELVRSWPSPTDHGGVAAALDELGAAALAAVTGAVAVETALDCRYAGQSHELTVPTVDAFHGEHGRRNGYARPDAPVEVVALRAVARAGAVLDPTALPVPSHRLGAAGVVDGPAVVAEPDCTIWVAAGWRAELGPVGALLLRRAP